MTSRITSIMFITRRDVTPPIRKRTLQTKDNSSVLIAGGSREFEGAPVREEFAKRRAGADLFYSKKHRRTKKITDLSSEKNKSEIIMSNS
ncbi:hypothetical protein ACFL96_06505 [Thermoproteota archaeon]